MTQQKQENSPPSTPPHGKDFTDERREETDVQRIHMNVVGREKEEPGEGFEPTPWWVWTASVLLLFIMGFYLGRYGGSFSAVAHEVEEPGVAASGPVKPEVKGDVVFAGVCQACHQASGLGIPGQYPPLAASEWLLQDGETPIRILLYGLQGEIGVKGKTFDNKMPQFHDKLSSDEIAAVLTHVRSAWGNKGGAVTAAQVDSVRKEHAVRAPWSAAELEALRKKPP